MNIESFLQKYSRGEFWAQDLRLWISCVNVHSLGPMYFPHEIRRSGSSAEMRPRGVLQEALEFNDFWNRPSNQQKT